ncbi:MAG: hypothetical protein AAGC55_27325, partial [Myxococcota bacterium]
MSLTLLLILVVIFSFVAGHFVTQYLSRFVVLSGAEYLLVGVLIGPQFRPHLLNDEALVLLQPIVSLLLGVLGFVLGLRARRALARRNLVPAALFTSLLVLIITTAVFTPLANHLVPVDESRAIFVFDLELFRIGDFAVDLHLDSEHLYLALFMGAAAG